MNTASDDGGREFLPVLPSRADEPRDGTALSIPPIDISRYRNELAELDLTPDQQAELLRTLYFIMATFVEWGFGVDSVQRALPALADFSSSADSDALEETRDADGVPEGEIKKGPADA